MAARSRVETAPNGHSASPRPLACWAGQCAARQELLVVHEHIGCDCMYVTMAPNVRKYIGDVAPGMVMVMLPSELRS